MTDAEEFVLSTYQFIREISCSNTSRVILVKSRMNEKLFIRREILKDKRQVYQRLKDLELEGVPGIQELIYDGKTIVIEDYIEGETLAKQVSDQSRDIDLQLLVTKLLHILKNLHDNHIIHRDIKAENVIIKPDGVPVLIDFAIAKVISLESANHEDEDILGTIGSAPPEQYGLGITDQRSDIYSFGRLCEVLLKEVGPLTPAIRQMWEYMIKKCTAFKQKERFQCVDDMLNILMYPEFLYDNSKKRILPFLHVKPSVCLQMQEGERKKVSFPWNNTYGELELQLEDKKEGICLSIGKMQKKFVIFPRKKISFLYRKENGHYMVEVVFLTASILLAMEIYTETEGPGKVCIKCSQGFMARQLIYEKCDEFFMGDLYESISGFAILGNEEVLMERDTLHTYLI